MSKRSPKMPTVLIIDDHKMVAEALSCLLKIDGFESIIASNGAEGIIAACATIPDLIICDYYMPGINGIDVLKELQSNPETKQIPLVLLTMENREWLKDEGLARGAAAVVPKSHQTEELFSVVKQLVLTSSRYQNQKHSETVLNTLSRPNASSMPL